MTSKHLKDMFYDEKHQKPFKRYIPNGSVPYRHLKCKNAKNIKELRAGNIAPLRYLCQSNIAFYGGKGKGNGKGKIFVPVKTLFSTIRH